MRCFSCNKKFDYEKYYGICPKCGCYNKPESAREQHQAYHDVYDGGYQHGEGHYNTYTEFKEKTGQKSSVYVQEAVKEPRQKTKGTGLLVTSIVFMVICIVAAMPLLNVAVQPEPEVVEEAAKQWEVTMYETGEEFTLQELTLKVTECKVIADWTTLTDLEKGKKLLAVRVEGTSDGEYEDYNRLAAPYLVAEGSYFRPLSSYDFEPYARMYDTLPLLGESDLQWDTFCDGWFVYLIDEACTAAGICFEECVWEEWEKMEVLSLHTVYLSVDAEVEGGTQDEV